MTPTHTKKPVNIRAFVFNGIIDLLNQDHVNSKLLRYTDYSSNNTICEKCNHHFDDHAYVETISGKAVVCPGDYVINNPQFPDDYYPCKPDIFKSKYDDIASKASSEECENRTYINSYDPIRDQDIRVISLKLDAAKTLLNRERHPEAAKAAVDFMKQLIAGRFSLEPVNDGMLFGEIMALINENNELLISRKAYRVDYIFLNKETSEFMAYRNGEATLHKFESKDYTANDWYIVN